MECWDGTLSPKEFYAAAHAFSEQAKRFNSCFPQWTWIPSPKRSCFSDEYTEGFLSAERVILPRLLEKDDLVEEEECICVDEDEYLDTAKLVRNHDPSVHCYDFHVVYNSSYRVPMLYFRAYCSDGQPLALDEIEKDIPFHSSQLLAKSQWTFITLEEHPILNRPWCMLHPCGTSEWMKLLLSVNTRIAQGGGVAVETYLVSWFSVVGQVFGIKIPFEMGNNGLLV